MALLPGGMFLLKGYHSLAELFLNLWVITSGFHLEALVRPDQIFHEGGLRR